MSTKKFKIVTSGGNGVKAGKNNTKTVLTGLGIVSLGGAGAALGYVAGSQEGENEPETQQHEDVIVENPERQEDESQDEQVLQGEEGQALQGGEGQVLQGGEEQQTAQNEAQHSRENAITEPQPEDGQTTTQEDVNTETTVTEDGTIEIGKLDEERIGEIARQIIDQQNIDPEDIDSPTIISVDELVITYRPDGSEALAARVHTPDGSDYLLADYDGDGFYTDVFDPMGNYIGEAEGNLMDSDLHHLVEDGGGYLAANDEPQGDDPTNDIINTDGSNSPSTSNDVAVTTPPANGDSNDVTDEELLNGDWDEAITDEELLNGDFDGEISDEGLLAQLLDGEEEDGEFFDDEEDDDDDESGADANDELAEI